MSKLVLASGSEIRAQILRNAGVAIEVVPAAVDEEAVRDALLKERATLPAIAEALAELKAVRVSRQSPQALVLGADQILVFEGRLISKSPSMEALRDLLRALRGKRHELFSAAVLARDGQIIWRHVAEARLQMRNFSEAALEAHLEAGGPDLLRGVGGYQIEGNGLQLFDGIEGDNFTIMGLPLLPLLTPLREHGILPK